MKNEQAYLLVISFNIFVVLFMIFTLLISSSILFFAFSLILLLLSVFMAIYHIAGAYYLNNSKKQEVEEFKIEKVQQIDILVPFCNEKISVVKQTLLSLKQMDYEKFSIILLDDSDKKNQEVEMFCKEQNIGYVWHKDKHGFKAGNLNDYLPNIKTEFFAIVDADEILINKDFLKHTYAIIKNKNVAYVQTIKSFKKGKTILSKTISKSFAFFFEDFNSSASEFGASMFLGSCALMRKKDIMDIGGFPENHLVEDTALSLKMDLAGKKGLFLPKRYFEAQPIYDFKKFEKQQYRYVFGNTMLFKEYLKNSFNFAGKNKKKTLHYLISLFGLHYISLSILFSVLMLIIASISYNYFFALGAFLVFIQMPVSSIIASAGFYRDWLFGILVYVLNFSLVNKRVKALIDVLANKKANFYGENNSENLDIVSIFACLIFSFLSHFLLISISLFISAILYSIALILRRYNYEKYI